MRMKTKLKGITALLITALLLITAAAPCFAAAAEKPDITAKGAIVYCQNTGEVVYSKNMNVKYCLLYTSYSDARRPGAFSRKHRRTKIFTDKIWYKPLFPVQPLHRQIVCF